MLSKRVLFFTAAGLGLAASPAFAKEPPYSSYWRLKGVEEVVLFKADHSALKASFQVCVDKTLLPLLTVEVAGGPPNNHLGQKYTALNPGGCFNSTQILFGAGDDVVVRLRRAIGHTAGAPRNLDLAKGTFKIDLAPTPLPISKPVDPCAQGHDQHSGGGGQCAPKLHKPNGPKQ